jgi:hypothetical protein
LISKRIAVLFADVAALGAATVTALSRTSGTKAARQELSVRVHNELMTLKCYVQVRTVTKEGASSWSQDVCLLVA